MNPVIVAILQVPSTALVVYALWRLWRTYAAAAGDDRLSLRIVATGFLVRALGGQVLFWISWLHLPVLRSLQLQRGYWFFAVDAAGYLREAERVLQGQTRMFTLAPQYSSHAFVEVLAVLVALCGKVASIALVLNCAAYLGTCLLILRLGSPLRSGRLVALAAVSFAPGAIVWSFQPLKDAMFVFLLVAVVAALASWQKRWKEASPRAVTPAVAILVTIYLLAGLRWYFAGMIWMISALFFLLVAIATRRRRVAMSAGALVFLLIGGSVGLGGGGDMRPFFEFVDRTFGSSHRIQTALSFLPRYVSEVRRGFEASPGATTIGVGDAVVKSQAAAPAASTAATSLATETAARFLSMPPAEPPITNQPAVSAPADDASPAAAAPLPKSAASRLTAGAAATFLPRALAQRLGLIEIRGGRGLWFFVELDTIAFDVVLLFAIFASAHALRTRRYRITPLFLVLVVLFLATTFPLVYAVTNFGTLFRLRQMLYVVAALVPLTLARAEEEPAEMAR